MTRRRIGVGVWVARRATMEEAEEKAETEVVD